MNKQAYIDGYMSKTAGAPIEAASIAPAVRKKWSVPAHVTTGSIMQPINKAVQNAAQTPAPVEYGRDPRVAELEKQRWGTNDPGAIDVWKKIERTRQQANQPTQPNSKYDYSGARFNIYPKNAPKD